jgi:hypothetical protein
MRLVFIAIGCIAAPAVFAQPRIIQVPPAQAEQKPLPHAQAASEIPLPRPRPPEAGPGNADVTPAEAAEQAATAAEPPAPPEPLPPSECFLALTGGGLAVAEFLQPIALPNGCGAPDVLKLEAVILADQKKVSFHPPATLRCSLAAEIANWIREDLVPATASVGTLTAIENGSFECRGRNRVRGAKLSEHGKANAMDIGALLFANRKRVGLTDPLVPRDFREKIKADACGRFATVLGPGSDGYHEEHIHVDLAERHNNYRICQWNVLDVPLPVPRPPEADAPPPEQASEKSDADAPAEGDKKP